MAGRAKNGVGMVSGPMDSFGGGLSPHDVGAGPETSHADGANPMGDERDGMMDSRGDGPMAASAGFQVDEGSVPEEDLDDLLWGEQSTAGILIPRGDSPHDGSLSSMAALDGMPAAGDVVQIVPDSDDDAGDSSVLGDSSAFENETIEIAIPGARPPENTVFEDETVEIAIPSETTIKLINVG